MIIKMSVRPALTRAKRGLMVKLSVCDNWLAWIGSVGCFGEVFFIVGGMHATSPLWLQRASKRLIVRRRYGGKR